jgi:hypothetical protein
MLLYRLKADPDLIDRHYQRLARVPEVETFRASAKLKLLGHALECLGYAKASGLFQPGQTEWEGITQAKREVRGFSTYFQGLDLQAVRQRETRLYREIIGDTCHAFRGLHLL